MKKLLTTLTLVSTSFFALHAEETFESPIDNPTTFVLNMANLSEDEAMCFLEAPCPEAIYLFPEGMLIHFYTTLYGNILHLDMKNALPMRVKKDFYVRFDEENLWISYDQQEWKLLSEDQEPSISELPVEQKELIDMSSLTDEQFSAWMTEDDNTPNSIFFFPKGFTNHPYAKIFESSLFHVETTDIMETFTVQQDFYLQANQEGDLFMSFDNQIWKPVEEISTGFLQLNLLSVQGMINLNAVAEWNVRE